MILIQNIKCRYPHAPEKIKEKAASVLTVKSSEIQSMEILRRSLDARKKPELYYLYTVEVAVHNEKKVFERAVQNKKAKEMLSFSERISYQFPKPMNIQHANMRPIVIGAGPAGLFCTYSLALAGLRPILLERGRPVEERQKDVALFWQTGKLDPESNVQFGEGGAGTFSDGKLNTLVKDKEGRNRAVLETFVRFGAKEAILYDAKPHIGTDELSRVIRNLREELLRLGAEIHFASKVQEILVKKRDGQSEQMQIAGVMLENGDRIEGEQVVLAIGHSARDTFQMLREKGIQMEAKPFAVGFRVEHPQTMINESQYGFAETGDLGAAAYKVTAKTSGGRGVYSFCMCPGGYVVNASSEKGMLAVNGMSYSSRNGKNANAAIIVSVTCEDYPSSDPLGGIAFQRELEKKAYDLGGGKIPVQRYGEFRRCVKGETDGQGRISSDFLPSCKGEYTWADLSKLLPEACNKALIEGMTQFGRQIKGFDREDAIFSGVESRTSSPVRILRDDSFQSNLSGLYPCGEGAGYAGGITSACMDGLRVAEKIVKVLEDA